MKTCLIVFTTRVHLIGVQNFPHGHLDQDDHDLTTAPGKLGVLLAPREQRWYFDYAGDRCYGWPVFYQGRVCVLWNWSKDKTPFEKGWAVVQPR